MAHNLTDRLSIRCALAVMLVAAILAGCSKDKSSGATSTSVTTAQASTTTSASAHSTTCPSAYTGIETDASMNALARASTEDSAREALQQFLDQYDLDALLGKFDPSEYADHWADWDDASDVTATVAFAEMFVCEWAKYPHDWIKRSRIRAVAFVRHLVVDGTVRTAMPDTEGETLYLDVDSTIPVYAERVVHHEYFHLIQSGITERDAFTADRWKSFNPPDFSYGSGGASVYNRDDAGQQNDEHVLPGFVTRYATSALEEDEAETYSYLMVGSLDRELQSWITTDAALQHKVDYLSHFIASRDGDMDESYFAHIAGD